MAVEVNVTCEGYSGSSASFVTQVRVVVDGETVATFSGAETQTFSGALDIEGAATVQVYDRTAGNDYDAANGTTDHGGPGDNLHGTYVLECPVKEDLDSQPDNSSFEPETLITLPLPVLVVEPSVPTTVVELSTVAPSTTNYSGQDDFYVATAWGPCFEDGSCLPGYELTSTTLAEPVGCCADYVAEVGTAPMLPATGPEHVLPMLGLGMGLIVFGIMCLNAKKPAPR